jgi:hypothetical protein
MTDVDLPAFVDTFDGLKRIFPLRGSSDDLRQLQQAYFKTLRPFPIERVVAGAELWRTNGVRFPKPAEWVRSMPRASAANLAEFTPYEAAEYRRAQRQMWSDEPCDCLECQAAGVTHRFLRYVPEVDDEDRDVRALLDGNAVTRGHWAHGEELRRYYAARDAYFELKDKYGPKSFPAPPKKHTRAQFDAAVAADEIANAKAVIAEWERTHPATPGEPECL